MYLSTPTHLVMWSLHCILSIPELDRCSVFNFLGFLCCHKYPSCHERTALYFSVARKNEETKMRENKTAYLKRKQGYEIKKLRINIRIKAV